MDVAPSVAGVDAAGANGDAGLGSGGVQLVERDDTFDVAKATHHTHWCDQQAFADSELDTRGTGVYMPRGAGCRLVAGGRVGVFSNSNSNSNFCGGLGDAHSAPPFVSTA